jgi:hypothetical protein
VATLRLELQDGFENDEVRTDRRISRADSLEVSGPDGPVTLEVQVLNRGLAAELRVDARDHPYVLVRIVAGRLEMRPSADMPGYF